LAVRTSGRSSLVLRPGPDKIETVRSPAALLDFFRDDGRFTWSASGGVRAEIAEGGAVRRTLEGDEATFDTAKVLLVSGGPGKPAVANAAEARIEAPSIAVAAETGDLHASGGVACLLKTGEDGRAVGFFSRGEDVSVASERLETRSGEAISLFSGGVVVRQGPNILKAGALETAGDAGRMTGEQGVTITLTEPASGGREARTVELAGEEMAFRPDLRILTLASKVSVGLRDARLEASSLTAVIGREDEKVESLTAAGPVTVFHGRYTGRAEAAAYEEATGRLTLTGKPVLTDGKGGSARGVRLTFSLTDDKIFIENEGVGRATTVVRS
jgi:lipopolysaccharide export system protein LptA